MAKPRARRDLRGQSGWTSYVPPPTLALARPTASLELRVSLRRDAEGVELLILDLDQEAGEVSHHDSLEQAQQFAANQTGLADIDWGPAPPGR